MFVRKSGRLNPNYSPNENCGPVNQRINPKFLGCTTQQSQKEFQEELQQQEFQQQRYFSNPQMQELAQEAKDLAALQKLLKNEQENNEKMESSERNASATTKALSQMEFDGADKKKWKKAVKIPMAMKRKKLNQRLSKILTPKSAIILLHELKPGCVYNVQEQLGVIPPLFFAHVDLEGEILGTGQGSSKSQAKNSAAENAIKNIVSKTMSRCSENKEGEIETEEEQNDTPENLPWAGLASFAIYKMFNEWQNQGTDLPITRPVVKKKVKSSVNAPTKKDLPPNAAELHPAVVLNMVNPGLTAIELERDDTPKCRVKMAYVVEGKMFSGLGGNKKDAKKEAAKAVLEGLYGLSYR